MSGFFNIRFSSKGKTSEWIVVSEFNTCKPTWSSWSVHLQMRNSIQNKTINTALLRSRSRRSLDRGDAQQAAQEHKEPQGDA